MPESGGQLGLGENWFYANVKVPCSPRATNSLFLLSILLEEQVNIVTSYSISLSEYCDARSSEPTAYLDVEIHREVVGDDEENDQVEVLLVCLVQSML